MQPTRVELNSKGICESKEHVLEAQQSQDSGSNSHCRVVQTRAVCQLDRHTAEGDSRLGESHLQLHASGTCCYLAQLCLYKYKKKSPQEQYDDQGNVELQEDKKSQLDSCQEPRTGGPGPGSHHLPSFWAQRMAPWKVGLKSFWAKFYSWLYFLLS